MSLDLVAVCVWIVVASVIGFLPSRYHWRGAALLVLTGIPVLGWVTWAHGPVYGVIAFVAGTSILRWPVLKLLRWLRQFLAGKGNRDGTA